jgi:hypothetical protein
MEPGMRWAWLLAAICAAGCTAPSVITPSELNAHAIKYDGKEVRVRAWLVHQFENIGLWDSKEAYDAPHQSTEFFQACVSYFGPDLGKHFVSRDVVLDGIFRKTALPPNTVSNGICNNSGLEIAKLPAGLESQH